MARSKKNQTVKLMAIIFTKSEQKIFEEYKTTFGFYNSADAYRGLIDLVEEKWTGIKLKNDQRFSIRLSMEDYNELERIGESLGGISKSAVLRRGVDFLHSVISDRWELSKWKEFAEKVPRFERTGKKKESSLSSGKMVVYSMNDISKKELQDVCDAFGESRTMVLRIALEAAKILPPEKLANKDEKKFHSTVRLREDEFRKMEELKKRLNFNGNGIFRTGIFLAEKELRMKKLQERKLDDRLSTESELFKATMHIPADTVRQRVIFKP